MRGEDSDSQIHATAVGEVKIGGSVSQGIGRQCPDSRCWYEYVKHFHIAVFYPLSSLDAQVHTQSTSEPGYVAVTPYEDS